MSNNFKGEPEVKWSSFMPALGYALGASVGPVVELGMGHFSSPFLHEYCKATNRELVSVEENAIWGDLFRSLGVGSHRVEISRYSEVLGRLRAFQRLGVVFIDSSPGGEARAELFSLAMPISEFVVVHDYHRENEEAIRPHLSKAMSHRVYADYDPPTLLATNIYTIDSP